MKSFAFGACLLTPSLTAIGMIATLDIPARDQADDVQSTAASTTAWIILMLRSISKRKQAIK
jgi:hypothetical protein